MAKPLFSNNAYSTLASGITNSATSMTVATGEGVRFPTPSGGDHFYCTLIDTSNNMEIVKVTAVSTDTFTIVRAQDGTSARAFSASDRVELRPTAAALEEIRAGAGLDNASIPANTIDTTQLVDDSVTDSKVDYASITASASEIRTGAADKFISPASVETAMEEVEINPSSWAWSAGISLKETMSGNVTIAFPTAVEPGTWRTINFIDSTGSRTINLATSAGFYTRNGTNLGITTTAGSRTMVHMYAMSTSTIFVTAVGPGEQV